MSFIQFSANEKVMELLLNNGANITPINDEEETALHWAVANRNEYPIISKYADAYNQFLFSRK